MKKERLFRFLPALLLTAVLSAALLTGCGGSKDTSSGDPDTAAASVTDTADTVPVLSDLFVPVDTQDLSTASDDGEDADESLLLYTGSALGDLSYPEYILTDSGLLLYDMDYSESEDSSTTFVLLDLQEGEAAAQVCLQSEFLTDIRQTPSGILLCDSSLGYAMLLDEALETVGTWQIDANYEYWYAGADGESVYEITEGALYRIALETGDDSPENTETESFADTSGFVTVSDPLLTSGISLYGGTSLNAGANITYVDPDTQLTCNAWLDLETGSLTQISYDVPLLQVTQTDGTRLAQISDTSSSSKYILETDEDTFYIEIENGALLQITGSEYLLYETSDASAFTVFDTDGTAVDTFTLPGDDLWYYGNYCIYSADFGGLFLLVYSDDGPQLFFRRIASDETETDADALTLIPYDEYTALPEGSAVDADLYARAAALGETYGIEIRIADQCLTEYTDFTALQETDEALIDAGLDVLEEALSRYPDGFFDQLKYDEITGLQINLCGTLNPTNEAWGEEGYNGLTEESGGRNVMVLDLSQLYPDTVYHEISHVIDQKLSWDAYCREEALFSEEDWEALNPEGFAYTYEYNGFTSYSFEGDEYEYFIDTYSMISPTEDRARILEYAMAGYDSYFTEFTQTMEKLEYYCACIRDAFDTTGWPSVTTWETVTAQ